MTEHRRLGALSIARGRSKAAVGPEYVSLAEMGREMPFASGAVTRSSPRPVVGC